MEATRACVLVIQPHDEACFVQALQEIAVCLWYTSSSVYQKKKSLAQLWIVERTGRPTFLWQPRFSYMLRHYSEGINTDSHQRINCSQVSTSWATATLGFLESRVKACESLFRTTEAVLQCKNNNPLLYASCPASCLFSCCASCLQHNLKFSVSVRKTPFLCLPRRRVQCPWYIDCKNRGVSSGAKLKGSVELRFCISRHQTKLSCAKLWQQISAPCLNQVTINLKTLPKLCLCWQA